MLAFAIYKTPFTTSLLEAQPGLGDDQHHGMGRTEIALPYSQGSIGRIRKMFKKVELSVSSYDTAWLATVPTMGSPQKPCFPQCLKWLLDNQHHDGSWSLPSRHDLMIKDSLMSTLASVLALRKWEIGEEHVSKGIEYMGSNFGAIMDKKQLSPIGFNIIFPSMVEHAKDLGLKLPLSPNSADKLRKNRNLELERVSRCNTKGSKSYLVYVSEGLTESYDLTEILKYQRKNGSLFNSPATTAALLVHSHDDKCLDYLHSLLDKYGSAVPTIYPIDVYIRLCMVDRIERLGISRHFVDEIKSVLDETYRCWLQRDEEIFLDMQTCALAFRLLKKNGYEISSDALADFNEEKHFFESSAGSQNLKDIYSVLELYKASEITTSSGDLVLETLHSWTSCLLNQGLENGAILEENFRKQVENALEFPYDVNLDRLDNRRNIESYNVDEIQILKTLHRCTNIANRDILQLAVEDYNFCQYIHQKELKNLERWVKESRFEQLEAGYFRQKLIKYIYLMSACMLFSPELSEARISWTKNTFLVIIVDELFDFEGSREELVNLIDLVEKWECISAADYCSNSVKIIYTSIYETINELGAIASTQQGRNVTSHLVDLWQTMLKAMMQEFEWATDMSTPTLNEYIKTSYITIGGGPCVLIPLYFLGSKLSEASITSQEYNSLYKLASICSRLLNDTQTFKREADQGKLNSVLLYAIHNSGTVTEQEAVGEISRMIECNKRDLLKLVLQTNGSIIPKACKYLLWNTYRLARFLYQKNDGFTSPDEILNYVNSVIFEPKKLL